MNLPYVRCNVYVSYSHKIIFMYCFWKRRHYVCCARHWPFPAWISPPFRCVGTEQFKRTGALCVTVSFDPDSQDETRRVSLDPAFAGQNTADGHDQKTNDTPRIELDITRNYPMGCIYLFNITFNPFPASTNKIRQNPTYVIPMLR